MEAGQCKEYVSGAGTQGRAGADVPAAKERGRVESQNRAGVDGPTAKGRVAEGSVKRVLAAHVAPQGIEHIAPTWA